MEVIQKKGKEIQFKKIYRNTWDTNKKPQEKHQKNEHYGKILRIH